MIRVIIDSDRDPLQMEVPLNATVRDLKTRVHNVLSPREEGPASTLFVVVAPNFELISFALRTYFPCFTTTYPVLSAPVIVVPVLTYPPLLCEDRGPLAQFMCSNTILRDGSVLEDARTLTYLGIRDGDEFQLTANIELTKNMVQ